MVKDFRPPKVAEVELEWADMRKVWCVNHLKECNAYKNLDCENNEKGVKYGRTHTTSVKFSSRT